MLADPGCVKLISVSNCGTAPAPKACAGGGPTSAVNFFIRKQAQFNYS
jgi:hypothetical protein